MHPVHKLSVLFSDKLHCCCSLHCCIACSFLMMERSVSTIKFQFPSVRYIFKPITFKMKSFIFLLLYCFYKSLILEMKVFKFLKSRFLAII